MRVKTSGNDGVISKTGRKNTTTKSLKLGITLKRDVWEGQLH